MIRNPITGNTLTADEVYEYITMNSKLYVGNMAFSTTEDELRAAFGQHGTLTDVYIANDRETGRPRGFAFVTFSTEAESKVAIEKMNGVDLGGRQLTVNEARPKEASAGGAGQQLRQPEPSPGRLPGPRQQPLLITGPVPVERFQAGRPGVPPFSAARRRFRRLPQTRLVLGTSRAVVGAESFNVAKHLDRLPQGRLKAWRERAKTL